MTITENVNIPVNDGGLTSAASAADVLGAALTNVARQARSVADATAAAAAAGLTDAGTGDAAVIASENEARAAEGALAAHRAGASAAASKAAALAKANSAAGKLKAGAAAVTGAIRNAATAAAGISFRTAIAQAQKLAGVMRQFGIGMIRQAGAKSFDLLGDAIKATAGHVIALDHAKRSLDQATGGRGAAALAQLTSVSNGLGQSITDTTEQFVKLRKDGLNNIDSTKAIKLRADLISVGASAEDADKEIEKFTKSVREGKDADKEIRKIADAYGAVGDGSNAAAKATFTLEGALQSLRAKADALGATVATAVGGSVIKSLGSIEAMIGRITTRLGPAISEVVTAGGAFVDVVSASGEMNALITALVPSFKLVSTVIIGLIPAARILLAITTASMGSLNRAIGAVLPMISRVSGMLAAYAPMIQFAVENPAKAAALAWQFASAQITAAVMAIGAAVSGAGAGMSESARMMGVTFASSLAAGILSGVGLVSAAGTAVGAAAEAGTRTSLDMHSPSRVAESLAEDYTAPFADTIEKGMNDITFTPSTGPGPAANGNAGGGKVININVTATGAGAEEIAAVVEAAVRRIV